MKNSAYWQKRMELLEDARHRDAVKAYQEIARTLDEAERQIQAKIETWINRVAINNQCSYAEARKWLKDAELEEFKWDVDKYIEAGKEHAITGQWDKELENASARAHISRLEGMQIELHGMVQNAYKGEQYTLQGLLTDEYPEQYYRTAYEVQNGIGVGWQIGGINERTISDIIQNPWSTDGRIFSERIWTSQATVADEIQKEMLKMFATGSAPDAAIAYMTQFTQATVKNAKRRAGTLVMTESAAIGNQAQADSFTDLGVDEYVIIATLDSITCSECGDWDGKVFSMKDRKMGLNAPPFHPNCRCATAPYFEDGQPSTRMSRNMDTGKSEYIPNMTYKEWKAKYVKASA